MPKVAIVDGVRIEFYPNEHPPPHFQALIAEYRAVFDIRTLRVTRESLPRSKDRGVREWAGRHRLALLRAWATIRAGEAPEEIG